MADEFKFELSKTTRDHSDAVQVCKVSHPSGFAAFTYQCKLNWDQDGDPQSYGWPNPSTAAGNTQRGIAPHESLANAGDPHVNCRWHLDHPGESSKTNLFRWAAIMTAQHDPPGYKRDMRPFLESRTQQERDGDGNLVPLGDHEPGFFPVIQKAPNPGYFLSATSATTDVGDDKWDQRNYVDATQISYGAHAGWWRTFNVTLGDFGLAFFPESRAWTGFVFGDTGVGRVGEVSTKFFNNIWPGQNPYNVNENKVMFMVFPASGRTIRPQDKFTSDGVVQREAKTQIQRLNAIDDILPLIEFLALGANKTNWDAFLKRKLREQDLSEADWRLQAVSEVFNKCGVTAAGL